MRLQVVERVDEVVVRALDVGDRVHHRLPELDVRDLLVLLGHLDLVARRVDREVAQQGLAQAQVEVRRE